MAYLDPRHADSSRCISQSALRKAVRIPDLSQVFMSGQDTQWALCRHPKQTLNHTSFRKMNPCLAGRLLAKIEYSCMASALTVAHGVLAAALVFGLSAKNFFLPSHDVAHTTKTLLYLPSCVGHQRMNWRSKLIRDSRKRKSYPSKIRAITLRSHGRP